MPRLRAGRRRKVSLALREPLGAVEQGGARAVGQLTFARSTLRDFSRLDGLALRLLRLDGRLACVMRGRHLLGDLAEGLLQLALRVGGGAERASPGDGRCVSGASDRSRTEAGASTQGGQPGTRGRGGHARACRGRRRRGGRVLSSSRWPGRPDVVRTSSPGSIESRSPASIAQTPDLASVPRRGTGVGSSDRSSPFAAGLDTSRRPASKEDGSHLALPRTTSPPPSLQRCSARRPSSSPARRPRPPAAAPPRPPPPRAAQLPLLLPSVRRRRPQPQALAGG